MKIKFILICLISFILFMLAVNEKHLNYDDILSKSKIENINKNKENDKIIERLKLFKCSIVKKDSEQFKKIVSEQGLIVIRNFTSGGYGIRGKDIRNHYKMDDIPANLLFDIHNENPIDLNELFFEMTNFDNDINVISIKDVEYNFQSSTSEIITTTAKILKNVKEEEEFDFKVFNFNNKMVVVTDAQIVDEILVGSFAIFEKEDQDYKLRCILNLK